MSAAKSKSTPKSKAAQKPDMKWFVHDRFGLFIHWGIYAQGARHEWLKQREQMTTEQYQKYFDTFYPDLYDPAEWARMAREAGMKYFVITTKHHDGFCLWDSKYTDYKVTKTAWGKDLIKPMVKAFRKEGLRVGFYHSLIDWHHPHFPVDSIHPQRNDEEAKAANKNRDVRKYAKYLRNQVEEILTGYGEVDYIFYDFSYPGREGGGKGRDDWESEELIALTRKCQPGIIVNDRLDLMDVKGGWDVKTPEQTMVRKPVEYDGKPVPWETCQTFSGSWGYYRDEETWKSVKQLLLLLIDTVSKDGNLLLNVGPTGRGAFDDRAQARLAGMGEWMRFHDRSIYGCGPAPEGIPTPEDCRLTYNKKTNRLYCHLFNYPIRRLHLDNLADKVEYAQFLHDASELRISAHHMDKHDGETGNTLSLELPVVAPRVEVPVVELFMK